MAATLLKEVAKVTSKGQTTLPKSVRQTLGVGAGDEICYEVDSSGRVVLSRATEETDPVMSSFLSFLASDMAAHPERIQGITPEFKARIENLVGPVANIDLDEAIEGETVL